MIDLSTLRPVEGKARWEANDLIAALGPWSVSRAKLAKRCAQHYAWQYLEKRMGDQDIEARDDSMRIGSAMHEIYEDLLKGGTDIDSIYNNAAARQSLTTNERETMEELFVNVGWFMERVHGFVRDRVYPGRNYYLGELVRDGFLGVEKKFALKQDLSYTEDYFNNQKQTLVRGVIDLLLFTTDGGAIVLDHKSSRFPNVKHFEDQLRTYTVAILAMYPTVEWVQCGVHFMPLQEVKLTEPVTRDKLESEQRALFYFLTEAANNVLVENKIQVGNHCKWCQYKTTCKALRKELRKAARLAEKESCKQN